MAWVIHNTEWLYVHRLRGETIPWESLFLPTVVAIVLFQGLPISMAAAGSISNMLAMRISYRVRGALTLLAFAKAQRLPLFSFDTQAGSKRSESSSDEDSSGTP